MKSCISTVNDIALFFSFFIFLEKILNQKTLKSRVSSPKCKCLLFSRFNIFGIKSIMISVLPSIFILYFIGTHAIVEKILLFPIDC